MGTLQSDEALKEDDNISAAEETLQFDDDNLRGEKTTCCLVLSITTCPRRRHSQASSTRIQTFLKSHILHPWILVVGALDHSGERCQKDVVSVSGFTGFLCIEGKFV